MIFYCNRYMTFQGSSRFKMRCFKILCRICSDFMKIYFHFLKLFKPYLIPVKYVYGNKGSIMNGIAFWRLKPRVLKQYIVIDCETIYLHKHATNVSKKNNKFSGVQECVKIRMLSNCNSKKRLQLKSVALPVTNIHQYWIILFYKYFTKMLKV